MLFHFHVTLATWSGFFTNSLPVTLSKAHSFIDGISSQVSTKFVFLSSHNAKNHKKIAKVTARSDIAFSVASKV